MGNFFTRTKPFYFYSDQLTEKNPAFHIENWSGVEPYNLNINLNNRENNLLKADYDIDYEIEYSSSNNIICQLDKTTGRIPGDISSDYFNITIIPNTQLKEGDIAEVSIKAIVKEPYKKTLRGRYIFKVGQEKLTYTVDDKAHSPYMLVNITNTLPYYIVREAFGTYNVNDRITVLTYRQLTDTNKEKCSSAEVRIQIDPTKYFLDMTNINYLNAMNIESIPISGHLNVNAITFKVDAVSSTAVRIYKRNINENNTFPNTTGTPNPVIFTVIR